MFQGVLQSHADQAFAAPFGHGLDADGRGQVQGAAQFVIEKIDEALGLGAVGGPLDAGIDVFGVFPENHHIDFFRLLQGAGHPGIIAHRADAGIEVQNLAQGDVQGPKPPADGGGEGSFEGHPVFPQGRQGLHRQITAAQFEGLFPGQDFLPEDAPAVAVSLGHRGVQHRAGGLPDIRAGAVAFDVENYRPVGNHESPGGGGGNDLTLFMLMMCHHCPRSQY